MNEKNIDDIVAMLDQFASGNGGHMNVIVHEEGTVSTEQTIRQTTGSDCAPGDFACKIPNLSCGIDGEDNSGCNE